MGWNQGFKIIEDTIISIYDMGKLDKDILIAILKPYANTDVDTGGISFRETKDGLDLICVMIKIYFGNIPEKPKSTGDNEKDNDNKESYEDVLWDKFFEMLKELGIK